MFKFRLAGHLKMTVEELGQRMSGDELREWMVLDRLQPLPDPWLQTGLICQTIAQGTLKRHDNQPWRVTHFMPVVVVNRPDQAPEETKANLRACLAGKPLKKPSS